MVTVPPIRLIKEDAQSEVGQKKRLLIHITFLYPPLWSPANSSCEIQKCLSASVTTKMSLEMRSLIRALGIFSVLGFDKKEWRKCGEDGPDCSFPTKRRLRLNRFEKLSHCLFFVFENLSEEVTSRSNLVGFSSLL